MKMKLSTKLFILLNAVIIIFILTIATIRIYNINDSYNKNMNINPNNLDSGKIISVEYIKTTQTDENENEY